MTPLGIVLVLVGLAAIALGVLRVRGPYAAYRRLQETAANLRRYDEWRGSRLADEPAGPTGADEMMRQLRTRVVLWGAVIVAGAVLVVVGLLLR